MTTTRELVWHALTPTATYAERQWATETSEAHDVVLWIRHRKTSGSEWECDDYDVEEQDRVGGHNPGRVFLLLNLTDTAQPDVYEVFVSDAGAWRDCCTCKAGNCRKARCKHRCAVRAWILSQGM